MSSTEALRDPVKYCADLDIISSTMEPFQKLLQVLVLKKKKKKMQLNWAANILTPDNNLWSGRLY